MIKSQDAIRIARSLIGTPYAELDCINLIKRVIRTAPGGVRDYTTAGTNALWNSFDMTAKYRDLTWRQEGLCGALGGMIAFKAQDDDWHHAGIVTDVGTVVHASSAQGGRGVVETPLSSAEGWTHLAIHRHIAAAQETEGERGIVSTQGGRLNLRGSPGGSVVSTLENGTSVAILERGAGWLRVRAGSETGWVCAAYVAAPPGEDVQQDDAPAVRLRIVDEAGNVFLPEGAVRIERAQD